MSRTRTLFFCTRCGHESPRWEGRCPACGEWNALAEAPSGAAGRGSAAKRPSLPGLHVEADEPAPLGRDRDDAERRIPTGFGELDRVLGGGLVSGSLLLLGGAPGVGKSTLLLQLAGRLRASGTPVLYVSGEESRGQVRLRAERLGGGATEVEFLAETDVERIVRVAGERRPVLLCVDSVQTLRSPDVAGAPGGVSQVRECAARLQELAKRAGPAVALVGHVTKGGALAGPRTLEHLVDVVLHFEGQRSHEGRILRGTKNRFGSVDEVAAWRMGEGGLEPLADPAGLFLGDRPAGEAGSAVAVPLLGTRPLPVEVQALSTRARFSTPQRTSSGFPSRRLSVLLAVLERRGGLAVADGDVFVNVVGGLRLGDPGADLAVLAALVSTELDRPVPEATAFVGEVGLAGEVRGVPSVRARVRAARRAGLERVVLPAAARGSIPAEEGLRFVERVAELRRLLDRA